MKRRMFVAGLTASFLCRPAVLAQGSSSDQLDPEDDSFLPPPHPDMVFAQRVIAGRVSSDSLFTDPVMMMFQVTGYASTQAAASAFPEYADTLMSRAEAKLDTSSRYPYSEISIGPIGDERIAFEAEGRDIVFGSTSKDVRVFILTGTSILHVLALSLGGETVEFVAEYLDGFVSSATDDPASLLPQVSDLPVGWEMLTDEPENLLEQVNVAPEQQASPTVAAAPEFHTLTGSFYVAGSENGEDFIVRDDGCHSMSPSFYVSVGGRIDVTNEAGDILATGKLEDAQDRAADECRFSFAIDVPKSDTYVVSPGDRTGYDKVLTYDDLVASNWHVILWISTNRY